MSAAVEFPYEVQLSIAGIGTSLACNHERLTLALRRIYADFPFTGALHFHAQVELQGRGPAISHMETKVSFVEGVAHFDQPGYSGSVDIRSGWGRLVLSSANPVSDVDYFVRLAYGLLAYEAGGFPLHSAGILRQGKAYLFFGPSGSGKTTVSRLSSGDTVLNDDLLLLLPKAGGWRVYGTPFTHPGQTPPTHHSAPLGGFYRLVQDRSVFLEAMSRAQAAAEIVANIPVGAADPSRSPLVLERVRDALEHVPAYRLHFLPDASFWQAVLPEAAGSLPLARELNMG